MELAAGAALHLAALELAVVSVVGRILDPEVVPALAGLVVHPATTTTLGPSSS